MNHLLRRLLPLIGVLAALLIAMSVLPFVSSSTSNAAATQAIQPSKPATPPTPYRPQPMCEIVAPAHYYAFDGGKESAGAFGPAPREDVWTESITPELRRRLCGHPAHATSPAVGGDWALLNALLHVVDGTGPDQTFGSVLGWNEAINEFMGRVKWSDTGVYYDMKGMEVTTYYMRPGKDNKPVVRQTAKYEPPSTYLILPVLRHDGTTKWLVLRLECGFQPVDPHEPLLIPGYPTL